MRSVLVLFLVVLGLASIDKCAAVKCPDDVAEIVVEMMALSHRGQTINAFVKVDGLAGSDSNRRLMRRQANPFGFDARQGTLVDSCTADSTQATCVGSLKRDFERLHVLATALNEMYRASKKPPSDCQISATFRTSSDKASSSDAHVSPRRLAELVLDLPAYQSPKDVESLEEDTMTSGLENALARLEGNHDLEEMNFRGWLRHIGGIMGSYLTIAGIATGIVCTALTIASVGAAAPVCLGIAIGFAVSGCLTDLMQARTWGDALKAVVLNAVDVATSFLPEGAEYVVRMFHIIHAGKTFLGWKGYQAVNDETVVAMTAIGQVDTFTCAHASGTYTYNSKTARYNCENPASDRCGSDSWLERGEAVIATTTLKWCALILPPHPNMGGSRNDRIAIALSNAVRMHGFKSFRMDYADYGFSTYFSTESDIAAAKEFMRTVMVGEECTGVLLVGYSHGAAVSAGLAVKTDLAIPVIGQLMVSPPITLKIISFRTFGWYGADFNEGFTSKSPLAIIYGTGDSMCDHKKLVDDNLAENIRQERVKSRSPKATLTFTYIENADHIYYHGDDDLGGAVLTAATGLIQSHMCKDLCSDSIAGKECSS